MAKLNLKSMSAFELLDLRNRLESVLAAKVKRERAALEVQLDTLSRAGGKRSAGRKHALAGKKIAPKYRGPNGETWSGRGLKPRWLAEALQQGKTVEDFLIAKPAGRRGKKAGAKA